jgi:hypothetical protein
MYVQTKNTGLSGIGTDPFSGSYSWAQKSMDRMNREPIENVITEASEYPYRIIKKRVADSPFISAMQNIIQGTPEIMERAKGSMLYDLDSRQVPNTVGPITNPKMARVTRNVLAPTGSGLVATKTVRMNLPTITATPTTQPIMSDAISKKSPPTFIETGMNMGGIGGLAILAIGGLILYSSFKKEM